MEVNKLASYNTPRGFGQSALAGAVMLASIFKALSHNKSQSANNIVPHLIVSYSVWLVFAIQGTSSQATDRGSRPYILTTLGRSTAHFAKSVFFFTCHDKYDVLSRRRSPNTRCMISDIMSANVRSLIHTLGLTQRFAVVGCAVSGRISRLAKVAYRSYGREQTGTHEHRMS